MIRIGNGYDVHRLVKGRKLILGGVTIPFEKGLLGHSDADVLTHAIMDALLGASALGDIGKYFPDNDPTFAGICSLKLLEQVKNHIWNKGWRLRNVDSVIIAQRPRLSPYILQMREQIALALKASVDQISIKATTTEGLGFTGLEEGIAAYAVVLIEN